jgi:hypothetical protein
MNVRQRNWRLISSQYLEEFPVIEYDRVVSWGNPKERAVE